MTDSDTLAACIAGGELRANQWGDSALFTPDGGTVRMYENTVRWELACLRCGGRRRVLAYVKGAGGVRAIVEHLGLPTASAHLAPARGPFQSAWC